MLLVSTPATGHTMQMLLARRLLAAQVSPRATRRAVFVIAAAAAAAAVAAAVAKVSVAALF